MAIFSFTPRRGLLGLAVILGIGACTDIVYRDRAPFNPPPDAASGFLGFFSATDRQTTCGNCHVGQQADWVQTKHAVAWDDLQANAGAQPFCEQCHTVNSRGNQPTAVVGYDKVKDVAYHDVQCESCHGPGFDHVQNPTDHGNRPIASANVFPTAPTTPEDPRRSRTPAAAAATRRRSFTEPQLPEGMAVVPSRDPQHTCGPHGQPASPATRARARWRPGA